MLKKLINVLKKNLSNKCEIKQEDAFIALGKASVSTLGTPNLYFMEGYRRHHSKP